MDSDIEAVRQVVESSLLAYPWGQREMAAVDAISRLAARLAPVDVAEFEGHTPGPWVWDPEDPDLDVDHGYDLVGGPQRETIADDGSQGGEYRRVLHPNTPNGRLIAAAPDMLRKLTEARARIATLEGILGEVVSEFGCSIEQYHKNGPDFTFKDGTEVFAASTLLDREELIDKARAELCSPHPVPVKAPYRVTKEKST